MCQMEMPTPNANVLSKKAHIVERLSKILPAESVIFEEHETRAYECDALTAYRCLPMIAYFLKLRNKYQMCLEYAMRKVSL